MITGKLSNGFKVEVDKSKIETYRFSKMIGKASSKDMEERLYANATILEYLIGEEQEEALIEHASKKLGHEVTSEEMASLVIEIINLMKEEDEDVKKSSPSAES